MMLHCGLPAQLGQQQQQEQQAQLQEHPCTPAVCGHWMLAQQSKRSVLAQPAAEAVQALRACAQASGADAAGGQHQTVVASADGCLQQLVSVQADMMDSCHASGCLDLYVCLRSCTADGMNLRAEYSRRDIPCVAGSQGKSAVRSKSMSGAGSSGAVLYGRNSLTLSKALETRSLSRRICLLCSVLASEVTASSTEGLEWQACMQHAAGQQQTGAYSCLVPSGAGCAGRLRQQSR